MKTSIPKRRQQKKFEKIFNLGDQVGAEIIADYFLKVTKSKTTGKKNTLWIIL